MELLKKYSDQLNGSLSNAIDVKEPTQLYGTRSITLVLLPSVALFLEQSSGILLILNGTTMSGHTLT